MKFAFPAAPTVVILNHHGRTERVRLQYKMGVLSVKRELLLALGLLLFAQAQAHASDWYLDVASRMGRVEAFDDTSFFLSVPWSNLTAVSQTGRAGESCTFTGVQFVPPSADRRKEWIGLLMTALAAGQRVDVFASCNSSASTLVVSRLVISYN